MKASNRAFVEIFLKGERTVVGLRERLARFCPSSAATTIRKPPRPTLNMPPD